MTHITEYWKDIFSFGTGIISTPSSQRFLNFVKIMSALRTLEDDTERDIAIDTHVCQGWDHTNFKWQQVVWPQLDCNLQPLRGKSTAAWRLDWRCGHADNSNAAIMDGEQPSEDVEPDDLVVKAGKAKGKQVTSQEGWLRVFNLLKLVPLTRGSKHLSAA
jgi:hypothetical protein